MSQRRIKLEPFNPVAANTRAILNSKIVLGNVIERLVLDWTGSGTFTKALITNIRVRLNGKAIIDGITGTQLDLLNRYLNLQNDANRLTIDFTELVSRSIEGQLMGAIHTLAAGVTDFQVELDLGAVVAPTLQCWAELRSPEWMNAAGLNPASFRLIRAIIPSYAQVTGAGEYPALINLGSRQAAVIKRIAIFSTVLQSFRVKRDNIDLLDPLTPAQIGYMATERGRQPQANLCVFDPLDDGNTSDAIPTLRADGNPAVFQWLPYATGAGTHTLFSDVYTTLDAL